MTTKIPGTEKSGKHPTLRWNEATRGLQGRFGHRTMMARATVGQFQIEPAINASARKDAEGDDEFLFHVIWYPLNRPRVTRTANGGGSINWHAVIIGGFLDLDKAKAAAQRYADTHELKRPPRRTKKQIAADKAEVEKIEKLYADAVRKRVGPQCKMQAYVEKKLEAEWKRTNK